MTEDKETPEERLDRLLRRERRKASLKWGGAGLCIMALLVLFFVVEWRPLGPERATILSHSQSASDDSVTIDYRIALPSGRITVMRARPIMGLQDGATLCVQRLNHPVFAGERVQRLPNSRCGL
ncbi:hypothetical protein [Tropicimonas sp. S265A]|uniref:hypothetical protein n=1 Tax=Tropicimonas sp. S265A TaxID=3415134 RepID=UPI003C7E5231